MQEINEQVEQESKATALTTRQNLQKIELINRNVQRFISIVKLSFTITVGRLLFFLVIIINDKLFISSKGEFSETWNVIFYVLASIMDLLVLLNDVQILEFINKEAEVLTKIKKELSNNSPNIPNTALGSYTNYLSLYDLVKCYKFKAESMTSINQTIRYLEIIITFYTFGNLALNAQSYSNSSFLNCLVLWTFLISIYFNVFELDYITLESSSGTFVEDRAVLSDHQRQENSDFSLIKDNYIKRIRRPFEIVYLINILVLLTIIVLYFQASLLSFMLMLSIITHMSELVYEKYLQNRLLTADLASVSKKYFTPHLILSEISKDTRILHIFITTLNRVVVLMTVMAYFRSLTVDVIESFLLLFANLLFILGEKLKFRRADSGKLYFLTSKTVEYSSEVSQCSICLLNCQKGDRVVSLPCFSKHIFHFTCMRNWFKERKECPLCRQSLTIYKLID